jgi:hypothetical protein
MFVPVWVAGALLVFLLGQAAVAGRWAVAQDRRMALMEQTQASIVATLAEIRADLKASNLASMMLRVQRLEDESSEHKAAHARNRERIDDLRDETMTLYAGSTGKHTPQHGG